MSTQEVINEAIDQMDKGNRNYAVIKPISLYDIDDQIDWKLVSIFFNTDKIDCYSQTDKLVIEV